MPKLHMYQLEQAVVFTTLALVAVLHGNTLAEWVGVFAVYFGFNHMSIADMLERAQHKRTVKEVKCYKKLTYYMWAKEACWLAYFVLLNAYTGLVGVVIFALYPLWRAYYKKHLSGKILPWLLHAPEGV
ncbi:MAG TPA: hypothetical protein VHP58_00315 [Alphaproteobacteria bacterium]|nr:hypothetical protein [Alphaproteobacteria bacterium]